MGKKHATKKILALLTAFTMVFAVAVNVSAATHTTVTEYDMVNGDKVTVKSTINDIEPGEEITYLAYDTTGNADPSSSNIVYIDQRTAESNSMLIEYTADLSKIGSTLVKFGAETTTEITSTQNTITVIDSNGITVSIEGTETGTVVPTQYILEGKCAFAIQPGANEKVASISYKKSGETDYTPVQLSEIINNQNVLTYTATGVTAGYELKVAFTNKTLNTVTRVANALTLNAGGFKLKEANDANNNITAFSKVVVDETLALGENDYEYGVLFSYSPTPTFTGLDTDWTGAVVNKMDDLGVIKYKAMGKGYDGSYAVSLKDGGSGYLKNSPEKKYYLRPYVVINGKFVSGVPTVDVSYSNAFEFDYAQSE